MRLITNPSQKHSIKLLNEFNRLKASIFYKDHSRYSNEEITNMLKIVSNLKTLALKSEQIRWITKFAYDLHLDLDTIKEDYLPVVIVHAKYREKLKPLFDYESQHDLFLDIQSLDRESLVENKIIVKEKDYGIIYSNDEFFIAVPETVEASQMLGKGTSWCTAAIKDNKYESYIIGNANIKMFLYYIVFLNRKPSSPDFKVCIGCVDGNILYGYGVTVNSRNVNLLEERMPNLKEELGDNANMIIDTVLAHSRKKEVHPMVTKIRKLLMDDYWFEEQLIKKGLYEILDSNIFSERFRIFEERRKLVGYINMCISVGEFSTRNIELLASLEEKHKLFSRDDIINIIKHQSKSISIDNLFRLVSDDDPDYSILSAIITSFSQNKLKEFVKVLFETNRSSIFSIFQVSLAIKRDIHVFIYQLAKDNNREDMLTLFDRSLKKIS